MGLHIKPYPDDPSIKLPLLDEVWAMNEEMVEVINVVSSDETTNVRASAVKRIGKWPIGALESIGGLFGNIRLKDNIIKEVHGDPLFSNDPEIINALEFDLYDDDDNLIHPAGTTYRVSKQPIRAWVFQLLVETVGANDPIFIGNININISVEANTLTSGYNLYTNTLVVPVFANHGSIPSVSGSDSGGYVVDGGDWSVTLTESGLTVTTNWGTSALGNQYRRLGNTSDTLFVPMTWSESGLPGYFYPNFPGMGLNWIAGTDLLGGIPFSTHSMQISANAV